MKEKDVGFSYTSYEFADSNGIATALRKQKRNFDKSLS